MSSRAYPTRSEAQRVPGTPPLALVCFLHALHLAFFNGHVDLARMLVERDADTAPQATPQTTATTCVRVHAK